MSRTPQLSPSDAPVADWQQFSAGDGTRVSTTADGCPLVRPKTVLQVVHGAAEHSSRYDRFAKLPWPAATRSTPPIIAVTAARGCALAKPATPAPTPGTAWLKTRSPSVSGCATAHPGAKLVLFGHSLGSFMAQDYIERRADLLDALVLSGTSYRPSVPLQLIDLLNDAVRKEPLGDSAVWAGLFKDFNKPFGGPTGFEWLSRDSSEVKKYVDDPLCGFAFTNELARDIFVGFARMRDPALEARIPKTLPVLVIQGELDPVGENLVGTRRLVERYNALGLTRIETHYYPGARHEVLNETNRDEVQRDVLAWLAKTV